MNDPWLDAATIAATANIASFGERTVRCNGWVVTAWHWSAFSNHPAQARVRAEKGDLTLTSNDAGETWRSE